MNRLADEEQASKDAAMLAARDGAPTMARVCSCEVVGEHLRSDGCPRHGLVEAPDWDFISGTSNDNLGGRL